MRSFLILFVCVVFLTACGGAIYKPKSWLPPQDDKVTSDWDVASTICDARAGDRELTPEEQQKIAEKRRKLGYAGSATKDIMGQAGVPGGEYVAVAAGFFSGLFGRKSSKEKEEFAICMEEYGWEKK